jgi:hypothetical protein
MWRHDDVVAGDVVAVQAYAELVLEITERAG